MYIWRYVSSWAEVLPDWYTRWRETKEAEAVSKGVVMMLPMEFTGDTDGTRWARSTEKVTLKAFIYSATLGLWRMWDL